MIIDGLRIPDEKIKEAIEAVGELEAQQVYHSSHWRDEIKARARGDIKLRGDCLPWQKTNDKFRMRPGELTVWAGFDGHMKSMLLGQIMADLAWNGRRIAIASMEMPPASTLLRMCRQVTGCMPSDSAVDAFIDTLDDNILIYDQLDTVEDWKILGFLHYVGTTLGCQHVVLDSLTKLAFSDSDYTAEIRFINRLQFFAKRLGVHVHLIAHCRKPQSGDESQPPKKNTIRGPSQITNLADNVMMVWMNQAKAEALLKQDAGSKLDAAEQELIDNAACQKLIVAKQREGEWNGTFTLWFHRDSLQFLAGKDHSIKRYGEYPFVQGVA